MFVSRGRFVSWFSVTLLSFVLEVFITLGRSPLNDCFGVDWASTWKGLWLLGERKLLGWGECIKLGLADGGEKYVILIATSASIGLGGPLADNVTLDTPENRSERVISLRFDSSWQEYSITNSSSVSELSAVFILGVVRNVEPVILNGTKDLSSTLALSRESSMASNDWSAKHPENRTRAMRWNIMQCCGKWQHTSGLGSHLCIFQWQGSEPPSTQRLGIRSTCLVVLLAYKLHFFLSARRVITQPFKPTA